MSGLRFAAQRLFRGRAWWVLPLCLAGLLMWGNLQRVQGHQAMGDMLEFGAMYQLRLHYGETLANWRQQPKPRPVLANPSVKEMERDTDATDALNRMVRLDEYDGRASLVKAELKMDRYFLRRAAAGRGNAYFDALTLQKRVAELEANQKAHRTQYYSRERRLPGALSLARALATDTPSTWFAVLFCFWAGVFILDDKRGRTRALIDLAPVDKGGVYAWRAGLLCAYGLAAIALVSAAALGLEILIAGSVGWDYPLAFSPDGTHAALMGAGSFLLQALAWLCGAFVLIVGLATLVQQVTRHVMVSLLAVLALVLVGSGVGWVWSPLSYLDLPRVLLPAAGYQLPLRLPAAVALMAASGAALIALSAAWASRRQRL
ncbi:hypothetical protein [Lacticaseibacillus kribbianus]|uniref:hypothetical protein n=1 Tax=Lacticaseibacillus kribbianus TaxID=2926292 RepID=UPI001CD3272C|nr:hypothetical protein [Lacticaseibacillus kribbianus]